MFPADETRASLALRQAALVSALISGHEPPPGFDRQRVLAAGESLARKRARSAARAWPGLAYSLGQKFEEHFAAYAAASPLPSEGGALADGHGFVRWLSGCGELPEAGRPEAMAVDLRFRRITDGLVRRRLPSLRLAWSRQSRRVTIAMRFPGVGERWFSF